MLKLFYIGIHNSTNFITLKMHVFECGLKIKIGPEETENSPNFFNNKIFIIYQQRFIQIAKIFGRPW